MEKIILLKYIIKLNLIISDIQRRFWVSENWWWRKIKYCKLHCDFCWQGDFLKIYSGIFFNFYGNDNKLQFLWLMVDFPVLLLWLLDKISDFFLAVIQEIRDFTTPCNWLTKSCVFLRLIDEICIHFFFYGWLRKFTIFSVTICLNLYFFTTA